METVDKELDLQGKLSPNYGGLLREMTGEHHFPDTEDFANEEDFLDYEDFSAEIVAKNKELKKQATDLIEIRRQLNVIKRYINSGSELPFGKWAVQEGLDEAMYQSAAGNLYDEIASPFASS